MARTTRKLPRHVSFEVVVSPESERRSVFSEDSFPTTENLHGFRASPDKTVEVARKLQAMGVEVFHLGDFSISARCTARKFETLFKTEISEQRYPSAARVPKDHVYYSPKKDAPWELPRRGGLDTLIDRAYIQHDPLFFAGERPVPPFWNDKFRLRVPGDVAQIMGATAVHRGDITGEGVRVAMVDTGFYHHPFFLEQGYNFLAVASPDVADHTSDSSGHGTGESANLFATAPGINFIGVKMGNPTLAFKTATELRPQVITCSWGYSKDLPGTSMPNWLKPLYLAVLDAVAKGIIVCFSAGNGHYGFPGSMPEVISVGGVVVTSKLEYAATKYASGFDSTWFPGRSTPDVCGLVGLPPKADYIVLPVQAGSALEKEKGWGAFSGTSAASPMVAGVCSLLKEADPGLGPEQVRSILKYTARDITKGINAHGKLAKVGPDGATGFGLVDAERAINAVI